MAGMNRSDIAVVNGAGRAHNELTILIACHKPLSSPTRRQHPDNSFQIQEEQATLTLHSLQQQPLVTTTAHERLKQQQGRPYHLHSHHHHHH